MARNKALCRKWVYLKVNKPAIALILGYPALHLREQSGARFHLCHFHLVAACFALLVMFFINVVFLLQPNVDYSVTGR